MSGGIEEYLPISIPVLYKGPLDPFYMQRAHEIAERYKIRKRLCKGMNNPDALLEITEQMRIDEERIRLYVFEAAKLTPSDCDTFQSYCKALETIYE